MYDQTKRRKTTSATGKGRNTVKVSYVDSGSGRGRVALEHTIVVGRVYTTNGEDRHGQLTGV